MVRADGQEVQPLVSQGASQFPLLSFSLLSNCVSLHPNFLVTVMILCMHVVQLMLSSNVVFLLLYWCEGVLFVGRLTLFP